MTRTGVSVNHVVYKQEGSELSREVPSLDPLRDTEQAPVRAFAFYYTSTIIVTDGDEVTKNDPVRLGGTYYLGGVLYAYDAITTLPGDHEWLLQAMRFNDYDYMILCRSGGWQPFNVHTDVQIVFD